MFSTHTNNVHGDGNPEHEVELDLRVLQDVVQAALGTEPGQDEDVTRVDAGSDEGVEVLVTHVTGLQPGQRLIFVIALQWSLLIRPPSYGGMTRWDHCMSKS